MCVRTVQTGVTDKACEGGEEVSGVALGMGMAIQSYTITIAIATVTAHQIWNIPLITQHTGQCEPELDPDPDPAQRAL